MLSYNQIKPRKYIVHEDMPWEVLDAQVSRKQQNKPVNKTRLRNLIQGNVIEYTFHVSDKVEEADMGKKSITFLFAQDKKNEAWFCASGNKGDRFALPLDTLQNELRFIKENTDVDALIYTDKNGDEHMTGIKLPITVDLVVKDAPPNIKGNTASGSGKPVTLETGYVVTVPFHVNTGDVVKINTERGDYVERVEKN